jgi:hypothetical protein
VCPAKKHLFSLQEASPEAFQLDDGVRLVDAWMRAYVARQEAAQRAEEELSSLKERIVRYAQLHELEVIVGTEYKLRVKQKAGLKVPVRSEDPAAYEALLERLRSLELLQRVSMLDRHAVVRLLDELPEDAARALRERLVPEVGARITPSRLSERERFEP